MDFQEPSKYITLVSADGFEFVVLREAAMVSPFIKSMLDPRSQFTEAREARCVFQEMSGMVLDKVVEYFHYWYRYRKSEDVPDMEIPVELCLELLAAADYLGLDQANMTLLPTTLERFPTHVQSLAEEALTRHCAQPQSCTRIGDCESTMAANAFENQGVRVAVEGCGHGTLNAIYASVAESCKQRGWDGVDLLIIGGDFQSVRNAADLTVMSCPVKYRHLGDFPQYYSGERTAPYLTIFIGGNHEASSHLWELYYGGWVAPNIYYMGAANVLRLGPIRIAGLSGIWKGFDYRKPHHERLPFSADDVKSFYHVREVDVRKLLLVRTQVDVGLSHDWPRAIERHGDDEWLFKKKPAFRSESRDGTLGSVAAEYVMDRLRPPYWFSAHMHVKFSALRKYTDEAVLEEKSTESHVAVPQVEESNPDEIDLDMDDDSDEKAAITSGAAQSTASGNETIPKTQNEVPENLRAQLPASFARPESKPKRVPGQPVPPGITNKEVRFLALDKCLPGRHFLQLCEILPVSEQGVENRDSSSKPRYRLQYDPEWLAINRVFHSSLRFGDRSAETAGNAGEEHYAPLVDAERAWVEENIVKKGLLDVPENFAQTAPPHVPGTAEIVFPTFGMRARKRGRKGKHVVLQVQKGEDTGEGGSTEVAVVVAEEEVEEEGVAEAEVEEEEADGENSRVLVIGAIDRAACVSKFAFQLFYNTAKKQAFLLVPFVNV
ncbi:Lariat debranching enzyme [Paramyrothecium foliicola]|nr:Lariat debranching enzyme [Paramyrothecium foliicola]